MKNLLGNVFALIGLIALLVFFVPLFVSGGENAYATSSPMDLTGGFVQSQGLNLASTLPTPTVVAFVKTAENQSWTCGSFDFNRVPDKQKRYFPADALSRINSKISMVDRIAREKNVPTLALLFVWWKEGAKGNGWSYWRASLRNTGHNTDGVVGMTDSFFKSNSAAYAQSVSVDDAMLEVQFRDAAKVLQEKARITARYGSKGYLTYNDGALDKTTLLSVEAYNGLGYRQGGVLSPYVHGTADQQFFDGYLAFVQMMNQIWASC